MEKLAFWFAAAMLLIIFSLSFVWKPVPNTAVQLCVVSRHAEPVWRNKPKESAWVGTILSLIALLYAFCTSFIAYRTHNGGSEPKSSVNTDSDSSGTTKTNQTPTTAIENRVAVCALSVMCVGWIWAGLFVPVSVAAMDRFVSRAPPIPFWMYSDDEMENHMNTSMLVDKRTRRPFLVSADAAKREGKRCAAWFGMLLCITIMCIVMSPKMKSIHFVLLFVPCMAVSLAFLLFEQIPVWMPGADGPSDIGASSALGDFSAPAGGMLAGAEDLRPMRASEPLGQIAIRVSSRDKAVRIVGLRILPNSFQTGSTEKPFGTVVLSPQLQDRAASAPTKRTCNLLPESIQFVDRENGAALPILLPPNQTVEITIPIDKEVIDVFPVSGSERLADSCTVYMGASFAYVGVAAGGAAGAPAPPIIGVVGQPVYDPAADAPQGDAHPEFVISRSFARFNFWMHFATLVMSIAAIVLIFALSIRKKDFAEQSKRSEQAVTIHTTTERIEPD
jgi:hypothetical protein